MQSERSEAPPPYLFPYLRAAAVHGPGFGSLLWSSPDTQAVRFEAFTRLWDLNGRSLLDVGCGRADLLDFLLARGIRPADYIGIEAVADLADEAERKGRAWGAGGLRGMPEVTILPADFVREPARLFVGADVVLFSGSLNTMDDSRFYDTLRRAYDAAAEGLVFNFLDSPTLAGNNYLCWRRREDVLAFADRLAGKPGGGGGGDGDTLRLLGDYLDGDCTVAVRKE